VLSKAAALIFDLDGTLVDSAPGVIASLGAVLDHEGIEPQVPLASVRIGPPLRKLILEVCGDVDDALQHRLSDAFRIHYDSEGWRATRPFDGVDEMLRALRSRAVPLYLATNKRAAPVKKILERLSWVDLFDAVYTVDDPAPGFSSKSSMLQTLARDQALTTAHYVGDSAEDLVAAEENGMSFAAAGWGYWNGGLSSQIEVWNEPQDAFRHCLRLIEDSQINLEVSGTHSHR
jgi:phosphoglycolate phosphatase